MNMMNPKEIKTDPVFEKLFSMDEDLLRIIEQDMQENGFDISHPIALGTWEGQKEPICIDGHTRLQAAINVGIQEVPVWIREDLGTEWDALECAIKLQCHRRNLTDAERINLLQLYDSRRPRGGDRRSSEAKSTPQNCGNESGRSASAKKMADMLGCSPRKVEQLRTVMDHADPDTLEAVQKGGISGNRAYQQTQKERKAAEANKPRLDRPIDAERPSDTAQDKPAPAEETESDHLSANVTGADDHENRDEIDADDAGQIGDEEPDTPDGGQAEEEEFVTVRISLSHYEALSEYEGTVEEMVEKAIELHLERLEREQEYDRHEYEAMWNSSDDDENESNDLEAA